MYMYYKVTNLTHQRVEVDSRVYVSANSTEIVKVDNLSKIERLVKLGVIKASEVSSSSASPRISPNTSTMSRKDFISMVNKREKLSNKVKK